ncbi:arginase family protein [Shimia abyssi]|uniref:Agmatinase n=1 Tax=Shimia abyssi TaxID=1662395 RepID=A0A2P8EVI5_9RHOB|nr:arginase family protein [Shimia abyssi]PSL13484.1 agmatinase [Shimia abyssi]
MPLRSAPLPRMAGHLSFMRSQTKAISDVGSGDLAVMGIPFEDTSAPHAGQSLAPRALRETSVYFGWHANPQFSHPVDIDARQDISTDGLHERLCDIGDIAPGSEGAIHAALKAATRQISDNGACAIILGGSDRMSETVQSALSHCQTAQLGCRPVDARDFHIAPLPNEGGTTCTLDPAAHRAAFCEWRDASKPLFVRFDLSVFETSLSALCDQPRLGGCDLETVVQWLELLGQHDVSAIMLTGLNPNRPGMGVVKVGQRLMVTALLAFIYARLGFGTDHPGSQNSKENVLT